MGSISLRLSNNKVVGQIVDDVAYLPVTSKNFFAMAKGYSIDAGVFETIQAAGCRVIDFWNRRSMRHFRVRVEAFTANARAFDFGYGQKLAAPMSVYEPGA